MPSLLAMRQIMVRKIRVYVGMISHMAYPIHILRDATICNVLTGENICFLAHTAVKLKLPNRIIYVQASIVPYGFFS